MSWSERSKPNVILCFRVPTTSVGARSEGSPQLSFLTPSSLPSPLSIPGSLEPPEAIMKPPACCPCFQLAPLAPSLLPLLPLLPEHPWVSGTFLGPQKAPSLLPLLPEHPWVSGTFLGPQKVPSSLPLLSVCSPCSQRIPGSLE